MKEKDYYEPVKDIFEKLFKERGEVYLEITADKPLSNKLKAEVNDHRGIVFYFLKEARPDICGYFKKDGSSKQFIILEIKNTVLKLDDIHQTRKYAELLEGRYVFLISTKEIPEEIKKLHGVSYSLLSLSYSYDKIILCQFDEKSGQIVDWYEKNLFEDDYTWK